MCNMFDIKHIAPSGCLFGSFILILIQGMFFSGCLVNKSCDPQAIPQLHITFVTTKRLNGPKIDSPISLYVRKTFSLKSVLNSSLTDTTIGHLITGFQAPLSNVDSCTSYVISIDPTTGGIADKLKNDTLTVCYSKSLHFISQGCGFGYQYSIRTNPLRVTDLNPKGFDVAITRNYFKAFKCINPKVTIMGFENIRLIF